jgi:hypothetical protein
MLLKRTKLTICSVAYELLVQQKLIGIRRGNLVLAGGLQTPDTVEKVGVARGLKS